MRSVNVGFTARSAALRAKKLAQLAHVSDSDSDDSASSLSSLSSDDDSSEDDDSSSSSDDVDDDSDGYSDSSDDDQDDDRSTVPTTDDEYNDGSAPSPKRRKRRATVGAANNTPTKRSKANILGDVSRAPTTLPDKLEVTKLGQFPVRARAKRLLHVGATPESLPCRQEQFDEVLACLEDAVQEGLGGCIYVSGVPGTGKTATVREVIRSLQRRADTGAVNKFNFCEINGMKLQDAQDTYSVLWHALTGLRCSNAVALRLLAQRFSGGGSSSTSSSDHATTVVLMDELDQLVTARQDVMYNMFNWPSGARSRLVVVAVANTMDLPERVLHAKVASRLGMTRITFRPYNDRQLVEIVHARLGISSTSSDGRGAGAEQQALSSNAAVGALPHTHGCDAVFAPEALVYLAKRVANVSGDARRMLDVCRRSIDAVEEARRHSGTAHATECISIGDMKRVIDAMVKSSKGAHIAHLALHAKLALVAVVLSVRRAGKAEVDLGTITATHLSQARIHAIPLPDDSGGNEDLGRLSSIANLVGQLCALGLVIAVGSGVASARSGRFARYILAVGEDDVRLALEQDDDSRLRSML